ncbi:hypothetical protein F8388_013949 [Cannabis sativa]|uniref:Arginyl-tRNA synthetase catalytic core domain-containing protein n=1 Tax=Cannabis sativa TaxID=3483 RepID=A0A7J6F862_CANSA|nr:hypothetical protein F8388_013949 [Cannabis sativa]
MNAIGNAQDLKVLGFGIYEIAHSINIEIGICEPQLANVLRFSVPAILHSHKKSKMLLFSFLALSTLLYTSILIPIHVQVKKVKNELSSEVMIIELPQHLQQSIADEVIQRLKTLGARANISEQGAAKQFVSCLFVPVLVSVEEDEIIACDASPMSVVFLACHRVLKEICQLAELNSNSIFLKVNYEELKPISKGGESEYRIPTSEAWSKICDISRREFDRVYQSLGVNLEENGESFYNPHIPRVIRELRELELVEESEGACVISIEGVISFPLNVVKSDDGCRSSSWLLSCYLAALLRRHL